MNELGIIDAPQFDYVQTGNPTIDVNPRRLHATWLNITTGELFVCIGSNTDLNVWRGQAGTQIPEDYIPISGMIFQQGEYTSGSVLDTSGNGNDIVVDGGAAASWGKFEAVETDAIANGVGMGVVDLSSFSVAFWAKPYDPLSTVSGHAVAVGVWGNPNTFSVWYVYSQKWKTGARLLLDNSQVVVGGDESLNYNHIAYVRVGDVVSSYLNGEYAGGSTGTVDPAENFTGTFSIGHQSSPTSSFKGWIARLRVYDRGLTSDEVLSLSQESNL